MIDSAKQRAAEQAETEGNYRRAFGFYKEMLTEAERYDSSNTQLIRYLEMKVDDCRRKM